MKREVIRIKETALLESRKMVDDLIVGTLTHRFNNYHYEFEDLNDVLKEFLKHHVQGRSKGPLTPEMEKAVAFLFRYANLFTDVQNLYEALKNHESVKAALTFKQYLGDVNTKPEEA